MSDVRTSATSESAIAAMRGSCDFCILRGWCWRIWRARSTWSARCFQPAAWTDATDSTLLRLRAQDDRCLLPHRLHRPRDLGLRRPRPLDVGELLAQVLEALLEVGVVRDDHADLCRHLLGQRPRDRQGDARLLLRHRYPLAGPTLPRRRTPSATVHPSANSGCIRRSRTYARPNDASHCRNCRRAPRFRPCAHVGAGRDPRQPPRGPQRGSRPLAGHPRLRRHRHPAARARADRRARHRAARRARSGQDADPAHSPGPARRVVAGDRRVGDRRAPVRADHGGQQAAGSGRGRRPPDHLAPPRRAVRREARDPGHERRGPHRRCGPHEGRRGARAG